MKTPVECLIEDFQYRADQHDCTAPRFSEEDWDWLKEQINNLLQPKTLTEEEIQEAARLAGFTIAMESGYPEILIPGSDMEGLLRKFAEEILKSNTPGN